MNAFCLPIAAVLGGLFKNTKPRCVRVEHAMAGRAVTFYYLRCSYPIIEESQNQLVGKL
jgi:hypothetical protein